MGMNYHMYTINDDNSLVYTVGDGLGPADYI